jgi:CubicO group peptidase (beta-lactamase class C family)
LPPFFSNRRRFLGTTAALAAAAFPVSGCVQLANQPRFDWTLHSPDEVGISRAGLERVRAAIQKHLDAQEQTGAVVAISRHNKLFWYEAMGTRDPATGDPMRKDDIFRMMSGSKHVTAIAVLMLVDAGRLSLDDKVSRFIPSFANPRVALGMPVGWQAALADPSLRVKFAEKVKVGPADREITVGDLLTHTSGLMSVAPSGLPSMLLHPDAVPTPRDTLASFTERLGSTTLDFQPGSRFAYSPLAGFDVLLRIVEIVSNQPAADFMRERLWAPLDMRDTYYAIPAEKRSRLVPLYERKEGQWRTASALYGLGETLTYPSGAAGMVSTARDYLQLEQMLLRGGELNGHRILRPETVARMARNHVGTKFEEWAPGTTSGMGFGLGVGVTVSPEIADWGRGRGAFGWGGAYGTESWVEPETGMAVVYLVQQSVRPALVDFQKALRDAVAA